MWGRSRGRGFGRFSLITQVGGMGDHVPSEVHLMVSGPPERE